jgi:hypothetical protein
MKSIKKTIKKILVSLCFLFVLNSFSQTEKETLEFLNSKLIVFAQPWPDGEPAYYNIRTGLDINENKIIIVDYFVNNRLLVNYKFHCNHINTISIVENGLGKLCLYLNSNESLILIQYDPREKETFTNEIRFILNAPQNEFLRIKKAFENLLKLNGAKLTDDNLFKN